jgi:hypothetical protein
VSSTSCRFDDGDINDNALLEYRTVTFSTTPVTLLRAATSRQHRTLYVIKSTELTYVSAELSYRPIYHLKFTYSAALRH